MVVLPNLIAILRTSQLGHWRSANFKCLYLRAVILEIRTSKKLRQSCVLKVSKQSHFLSLSKIYNCQKMSISLFNLSCNKEKNKRKDTEERKKEECSILSP
jgi:hypothetical protein